MTPPPLHGEEYRENACDFLAALLHEEAKPQQAEDAAWQDGSESADVISDPLDKKHSKNIHELYTLWWLSIAIENGPCIVDLRIAGSEFW